MAWSRWDGLVVPTSGGDDDGIVPQPRQRHLRPADSAGTGDRRDGVDDGAVAGLLGVEHVGEGVWPLLSRGRGGRGRAGSTRSCRSSRRRAAPASPAPPRGRAGRSGSASRRPGPAVISLQVQHLAELPGVHRHGAVVARFAGLHDVVQVLQRLHDRGRGVNAVDLIEVDVVGAELAQAVLDLGKARLARHAGAFRARAHRVPDLRGDHDRVAVGEVLQRPADDLPAGTLGSAPPSMLRKAANRQISKDIHPIGTGQDSGQTRPPEHRLHLHRQEVAQLILQAGRAEAVRLTCTASRPGGGGTGDRSDSPEVVAARVKLGRVLGRGLRLRGEG
jgi:hypothetical protein